MHHLNTKPQCGNLIQAIQHRHCGADQVKINLLLVHTTLEIPKLSRIIDLTPSTLLVQG